MYKSVDICLFEASIVAAAKHLIVKLFLFLLLFPLFATVAAATTTGTTAYATVYFCLLTFFGSVSSKIYIIIT